MKNLLIKARRPFSMVQRRPRSRNGDFFCPHKKIAVCCCNGGLILAFSILSNFSLQIFFKNAKLAKLFHHYNNVNGISDGFKTWKIVQ